MNSFSCLIDGGPYFGKKFEINIYGFRMNVHIFFDPDKISSEISSFREKLAEMDDSLAKMTVMPAKNSNYYRYFDIKKKEEEGCLVFGKTKMPSAMNSRDADSLLLRRTYPHWIQRRSSIRTGTLTP